MLDLLWEGYPYVLLVLGGLGSVFALACVVGFQAWWACFGLVLLCLMVGQVTVDHVVAGSIPGAARTIPGHVFPWFLA